MENGKILDIKNRLNDLYKKNIEIHVYVQPKRKRVNNAPCKIKGVYDKFIIVESKVGMYDESFSITYVDIYIGNIIIKELL